MIGAIEHASFSLIIVFLIMGEDDFIFIAIGAIGGAIGAIEDDCVIDLKFDDFKEVCK